MFADIGKSSEEPDTELYSDPAEGQQSSSSMQHNEEQQGEEGGDTSSSMEEMTDGKHADMKVTAHIDKALQLKLSPSRHNMQPAFQRRANLKQYPLVRELQRIAAGYMLAHYADQMLKNRKQLNRQSKAQSERYWVQQNNNNRIHQDMDFGDSKTAFKYIKHKQTNWPVVQMSKRNSAELYNGVMPNKVFDADLRRMAKSTKMRYRQGRPQMRDKQSRNKRPTQRITGKKGAKMPKSKVIVQ